jgi:hypothetical protein
LVDLDFYGLEKEPVANEYIPVDMKKKEIFLTCHAAAGFGYAHHFSSRQITKSTGQPGLGA